MKNNKELFKKFLTDFAQELATEDLEENRTPISNLDEFLEEISSIYKEELQQALEYYEERYKTEKYIACGLSAYEKIKIKDLQEYIANAESLEEAIGEYLTEESGYCHNGFDFEIDGDVVKVSNIDWDLEE